MTSDDDRDPLYPTGGALAYRVSSDPDHAPPRATGADLPAAPDPVHPSTRSPVPFAGKTILVRPEGGSLLSWWRRTRPLDEALRLAFQRQDAGQSTRLLLAPGIYRFGFAAPPAETTGGCVNIEAQSPGSVTLRGSDVVTPWLASDGRWRVRWPHRWGLGSAPDTYGNPHLATADLMRRREMVFIDGRLLRQVLSASDLDAGTYCVDEDAAEIVFSLPPGSPSPGLVEVGTRSGLIELSGRSDVRFHGLRFEHDASGYFVPQRAALMLTDCRDILIEDCAFEWNNVKGLQIGGRLSERITVRRSRANHNGCLGILASRTRDLSFEDCETSFNNWRGAWAGKYRGSPCGIKIMRSVSVSLLRHRALRNLATGIWLDEENADAALIDCSVYGNFRGIHIEAGPGPVRVERCTVVGNRQDPTASSFRWAFGSGIAITHAAGVLLRDNFVADNDVAQVGVRGDRPERVIVDPIDNRRVTRWTEHLEVERNTLVATGLGQNFMRVPARNADSGRCLDSLRSRGNQFLGRIDTPGFELSHPDAPPTSLTFAEWKTLSGQDADSRHDLV